MIEYEAYRKSGLFGFKREPIRMYAIVTEFKPTRLLVFAPDPTIWEEGKVEFGSSWIVSVDKADKIKILKRFCEI